MTNIEYTTPLQEEAKLKIEGVIKAKYRDDIKFSVCKITYEEYDNNEFQYSFEPYYDILDALPTSISQGIPGINLAKRKKVYYRVNKVPSFISERTMDESRENLNEELRKVYMTNYNPLEWLIRTDSEYSGDNLIVETYREPRKLGEINYNDLAYGDSITQINDLSKDVHVRANQLLKLLGNGVDIKEKNLLVNKKNREGALLLLIHQYEYAQIQKLKKQEETKKKTPKNKINDFLIEEIIKELELKIIDYKEAMQLIGVQTKATLLKKIREYKKANEK